MLYTYIVLLICVNETVYLFGNLPLFKIHVNGFMPGEDSPGASVISKYMLWVRGLVPLSKFEAFPFSDEQTASGYITSG